MRGFLDYAAGVLTLVLLTAAVCWGLLAGERTALATRHRLLAQAIHRATAVAALGALALHVGVKVAEARVGVRGALVPFGDAFGGGTGGGFGGGFGSGFRSGLASAFAGGAGTGGQAAADGRALVIGIGSLAAWLLLAAVVTGVLRGVLAGRGRASARWRALHACAYPAWCAALVHGLKSGRAPAGWVTAAYVMSLAAVAGVLVWRCVRARRARTTRGGPPARGLVAERGRGQGALAAEPGRGQGALAAEPGGGRSAHLAELGGGQGELGAQAARGLWADAGGGQGELPTQPWDGVTRRGNLPAGGAQGALRTAAGAASPELTATYGQGDEPGHGFLRPPGHGPPPQAALPGPAAAMSIGHAPATGPAGADALTGHGPASQTTLPGPTAPNGHASAADLTGTDALIGPDPAWQTTLPDPTAPVGHPPAATAGPPSADALAHPDLHGPAYRPGLPQPVPAPGTPWRVPAPRPPWTADLGPGAPPPHGGGFPAPGAAWQEGDGTGQAHHPAGGGRPADGDHSSTRNHPTGGTP